jgi:vacuolar-type H+-ATPase subunit H
LWKASRTSSETVGKSEGQRQVNGDGTSVKKLEPDEPEVSDVIDKLLATERDAREIIADGRRRAEATLEQARIDARKIAAEQHQRDVEQAAQRIADAEAEAERRRAQCLAEEEAALAAADAAPPERVADAVQSIVRAVAPSR